MSALIIKRQLLATGFRQFFRYSSTETVKPIQGTSKPRATTVDPKDVKVHGGLSNDWWDGVKLKPLHSFNPLRIQLIRDGLANVGRKEINPGQPLEGVTILDVGCGGGILSEPLARIGATVTGIDASSQMIEAAKEHATLDPNLSDRLTYIHTSIEDHLNTKPKIYDAVVASEILEHVADPELFLKCCSEILKPGGSIFITTLNKTLASWLYGIVAAEYVFRFIPLGTHDWNKFISPEDTQRLLDKYGCKTKLVHGSFYNPVKNQWSWSSSTSIFYSMHAIKSDI